MLTFSAYLFVYIILGMINIILISAVFAYDSVHGIWGDKSEIMPAEDFESKDVLLAIAFWPLIFICVVSYIICAFLVFLNNIKNFSTFMNQCETKFFKYFLNRKQSKNEKILEKIHAKQAELDALIEKQESQG